MKQSTCGAVICQPGGDELKHDSNSMLILGKYLKNCAVLWTATYDANYVKFVNLNVSIQMYDNRLRYRYRPYLIG